MRLRPMAKDALHLILHTQLLLLEIGFFDLFGIGEVGLSSEFVKSAFEFVVPVSELMKLAVGSQQQFPELLVHAPPPVRN
jgi:hypothetical protein